MGFVQRTKTCGELRAEHAGQEVTLNGWAHKVRDLGGVLFIDLRDRNGLVQLTFDPASFPNRLEIRSETCLSVTGKVKVRAEETKNPKMSTGDIEVIVTAYTVLGAAKPLPFPLSDEDVMETVNEELRIKHRYLDLRRSTMYRRLAIRSSACRRMREYLTVRDFLEVETPIITKSTPEGARDYLVAYRQNPGMWYALPDCQVLPRRELPRRPTARVHPARPGDVVRYPGRHPATCRGDDARCGQRLDRRVRLGEGQG